MNCDDIKELQWSPPQIPTSDIPYPHVIAETPFGRFVVSWKTWKSHHPVYLEETPWFGWYMSYETVEAAKAAAHAGYCARILASIKGNDDVEFYDE